MARVLFDTGAEIFVPRHQAPHRLCLPGGAPLSPSECPAEPSLWPLVCAAREAQRGFRARGRTARHRATAGPPARPPVGRRETARRHRPGAVVKPEAASHGRAARLTRSRPARPKSCPISKGCATRRAFRSSMSAIRSRRWRGWRPTSLLLADGTRHRRRADRRDHAAARPVPRGGARARPARVLRHGSRRP